MKFGPSGHDHGLQNELFLTLETPEDYKQFEKHPEPFLIITITEHPKIVEFDNFESFEKRGPTNHKAPSYKFSKILNL